MAHINFRLTGAIFNSQLIHMSGSLVVKADPANMGLAVEIVLRSYIQAGIYVMSYLLPVKGRHTSGSRRSALVV